MTGNGESCSLWFREKDHDIIIDEGDDDDDGLRYYHAKSAETRGFRCTFVNYDNRGWERTTLEEGEMEILMGGTPHPDDWDEIHEWSWNGEDVEMDSMVFDDDDRMEIMKKIYDRRGVSKEKGENEEKAQSTDDVGTNFRKTKVKLESFLDGVPRKKMFALVGRWDDADVTFSVENTCELGGVRACMYQRLTYEDRKVDEGFFLF